jgi:methanogenic corrinoid protein MtbC1
MHDDLYDGLKEEIEEGVNILLERGWTPYDILTKALVEGMRIVGVDFRDGILFVPEVLLAANAMKAGMEILRPCWPKPAHPSRSARWSSAPSRATSTTSARTSSA